MKNILTLISVAVLSFAAFGQSTEGISKLRQAQDLAVDRIVSSLSDTNRCSSDVAKEVKDLAGAVTLLQTAESRSYTLADERDKAPQTMTKSAMERSLAEAKAMGVSRSLRNNLEREWSHTRTLEQADMVVSRAQLATAERSLEIADRGSFRRFLPEFIGGTSSYANHRVPQPVVTDTTPSALAGKVNELERRLIGLTATVVPTAVK
ncbi:hypothetical protein EKK58_00245 [Candidatus Dependentiae bacterium]|nr:MAG: hypothetical protein EKK58_00245 [Candidatus Dependentiae bacterium]